MATPRLLVPPAPPPSVPRHGAALALGVALGGFLDGIVLHQVLQWHHLLSAVDAPGFADLRVQVLADGLFHAAMYVVATVALVRLAPAGTRPDGRALGARVLLGFALWHVLDAVLSHWLIGLHRIRMDTAHPLAWDLGWLLAFGGLPAWIGLRRLRAAADRDGSAAVAGARLHGWIAVTVAAAAWAARPPAEPPDGGRAATVVLRDARDAPRLLAALGPDARVVGSDRLGEVWRLRLAGDDPPWRLFAHGALWVAAGPLAAGCAGGGALAADPPGP